MRTPPRIGLGIGLLALCLLPSACIERCQPNDPRCCDTPDCRGDGLTQDSPESVLQLLIKSYTRRDIVLYASLLAGDFQFWFDPDTRPSTVPDFWTRQQDSTGTGNLFAASDVSDIRIRLTYGTSTWDNTLGHAGWRKIRVTDTFLEVDKVPPTGEVVTLRVDGDVQDFYFRRGRTPADTLATSPTARLWYLVEWRDLARLSGPGRLDERGAAAARPMNLWGSLKENYRSR